MFYSLSLDSVFELIYNNNLISIFTQNYIKSYGRVSSLFNDEYVLGSNIRLLPIACALSIVLIKNKFQNIVLVLIICVSSLIIFISGERTALAMLIIFLLSVFLFLTI